MVWVDFESASSTVGGLFSIPPFSGVDTPSEWDYWERDALDHARSGVIWKVCLQRLVWVWVAEVVSYPLIESHNYFPLTASIWHFGLGFCTVKPTKDFLQ